MSETVVASIIGVGGAVIVAVVTVLTQLSITRSVVRAERARLKEQIIGEEYSRARDRREERLHKSISELLTASDPESGDQFRYSRVANLIVYAQLLLDLSVPAEKNLNGALNVLGIRLRDYYSVRLNHIDHGESHEVRNLLRAHSEVIDCAKIVFLRSAENHNICSDNLEKL